MKTNIKYDILYFIRRHASKLVNSQKRLLGGKAMEYNLCTKIRQAILEQKSPFCLSDIYTRLKWLTDDRDLILQCVDELLNAKLLDFRHIKEDLWAFVVT